MMPVNNSDLLSGNDPSRDLHVAAENPVLDLDQPQRIGDPTEAEISDQMRAVGAPEDPRRHEHVRATDHAGAKARRVGPLSALHEDGVQPPAGELRPISVERPWGLFERRFAVPNGSDTNEVEARYVDGVLELRFATTPIEQQSKSIRID